jgi:RNA polymerase sigma-70 factor (ECF subfamily)
MPHQALSMEGVCGDQASDLAEPRLALDEEAFCALYRSIAPALAGYIRKSCRDAPLAEDLLQETFYRFLRAGPPEMDPRQTKAYLYRIATSLIVDHWRQTKQRQKRESFWHWLRHPGSDAGMEPAADGVDFLSGLPPREQALLWLAYFEGFDHGEIAAALGLREKSVRVLLFRARRKLALILKRRNLRDGAKGVV